MSEVSRDSGGGFIIDNPDPIRMRYMSLYFRLRLEVKTPGGPTWRQPPAQMCRQILVEAGRPDPGRIKKKVYNAFGAYLVEMDFISTHEVIK